MKASTFFVAGSVLFSMAASATGIIPVLDLDYTRSADQTLKKLNIHDGCIVDAPDPVTFTYCREGSRTLWKYQVLDLQQQAAIRTVTPQPQMDHGQISILELNSPACDDEAGHEAKPARGRACARTPCHGKGFGCVYGRCCDDDGLLQRLRCLIPTRH